MQSTALKSLYGRIAIPAFDRLRDPSLLFVRVTWGWMFFQTGYGKLGNLTGTAEFFASLGLPAPFLNAVAVGLLECVGGLLLLGGLASRSVALLLCGNMVVAYLTAHRDAFAGISAFVGALPYPYLLAALLVLAFGPGRLSLDALFRRPAMREPAIVAARPSQRPA